LTGRWLSLFEGIRSDAPPWLSTGDEVTGSPLDGGVREIGRVAADLEAIFGKGSGSLQEGTEILRA